MERKPAEGFKSIGRCNKAFYSHAICARKEIMCGDIASLQGITRATLSHHLKPLADAGLTSAKARVQSSTVTATGRKLQQYMGFFGSDG
jgi:DNA-binding transcriptional ArsR family regulator